jgi:hypothetical protein
MIVNIGLRLLFRALGAWSGLSAALDLDRSWHDVLFAGAKPIRSGTSQFRAGTGHRTRVSRITSPQT